MFEQMSKRVLVCGGRDYGDAAHMAFILDHMVVGLLIHGGASGADTLAGEWAKAKGVPVEVYPADWERDGKAAGPIRNLEMLSKGRPELVIAFPGGKGTAHMRKIAKAHGVQVVDVKPIGLDQWTHFHRES
jgi:hypothetical protein